MEIELVDNSRNKNSCGTREGNELDKVVAPEIWDNDYVPIVSTINNKWNNNEDKFEKYVKHNMYFNCEIGSPDLYSKCCYYLENIVEEEDIVNININNGGGNVDSAAMLRDAIKNCKGKTIAKLSGLVASGATLIALSCDDIVCGESVSWLSHNYSAGVSGKGHEIRAQSEFMEKELNRVFRIIHNGFFTDKEMEEIIDGKDYWLNADEVTERWDKYCTVRDNNNDNKDSNND